MEFLHQLFSFVCGQQHTWSLGGEVLPFCQRCTGLYVGAALALLPLLLFRPRPTARVLWLHGLLLLLMVPFGYHLVPQNAVLRTLTGQLFAFGLAYYLTLTPALHQENWRPLAGEHTGAYAAAGLVTLALLQLAVHFGGVGTAHWLAWTGFAGLLIYSALAALNLVALSASGWQWLRDEPAPR